MIGWTKTIPSGAITTLWLAAAVLGTACNSDEIAAPPRPTELLDAAAPEATGPAIVK